MGKIQAFTIKWLICELLIAAAISSGAIAGLELTHTNLKPRLTSYQDRASNLVTGDDTASNAPSTTPSPSPSVSPAISPKAKTTSAATVASKPGTTLGAATSVKMSDAAVLAKIQATPHGIWATGGNAATDVQSAINAGPLASLIIYDIPGRDCGNYSSGGAANDDAYRSYIQAIATAIGGRRLRVILEPDALALGCTETSLFADTDGQLGSVTTLKRAGASVYIDAGHAGWLSVAAMAAKLQAANIAGADGFSLNVSNFDTSANEISYGNKLSALTGGKHYVIDTSRNGNGASGDWCNPTGRALGTSPTLTTGSKLVDAYLWLKIPGESDGTCNGGPAAGLWWPGYALGLGRAAGW